MQSITEIHIQNYRSCSDVRVPLGDLTILVGRNNSGKSNIMRAAQWLLKKSPLVESDFGDPGRPVVVSGTVSGLDSHVLGCLGEVHRTRIQPHCQTGSMQIRRTQNKPGAPSKEISLEVRDGDTDGEWARNPTGIDQAIAALFPDPIEIAAMQDVPEDVAKIKSGTTIEGLLRPLIEPICNAHRAALEEGFDAFNSRLSATGGQRAQEAQDFDAETRTALQDFFPGVSLFLDITMPEVTELFKRATIKVQEDGDDAVRGLSELGHGAQRAIQMALVRYLASKKVADVASRRTLLLVEEPELYLHPQAVELVRRALHLLSQESYQVIYSTHSPLMVHRDHVADAVVVQKPEPKRTAVRQSIRGAVVQTVEDAPVQADMLFEFGRASEILFSDRVLLAEGATEQRLLPALFEAFAGQTHLAARLGIVTLGGSGGTAKALRILSAMGLDGRALVDLDYAFTEAVRAGYFEDDDPDLKEGRQVFEDLERRGAVDLGDNRLPCKRSGAPAVVGYRELARHEAGRAVATRLHDKLIQHGIWLWLKGTIEDHLGLDGKTEREHSVIERRLRQDGQHSCLADPEGVRAFVEWLSSP